MNKLRKHLESAREDYHAIRYDGDLAADILNRLHAAPHRRQHGMRWIWRVGTLTAAAAALVVVFRTTAPTNTTPNAKPGTDLAMVDPSNQDIAADTVDDATLTEVAWSDLPSLSTPSTPSDFDTRGSEDMNMAPSMDFTFSVPSFSLLEDQAQQQQQSRNPGSAEETLI